MEKLNFSEENKFKTPEEELDFLRGEVKKKERELEKAGEKTETHEIISQKINEYKQANPEEILSSDYKMGSLQVEGVALSLSPENHDSKILELSRLLNEKGVLNTLSIIEKMGDQHLADDFHRFLVQYIKKGFAVSGLDKQSALSKALEMTLYEITLPDESNGEDSKKGLKEIISSMEQFFAGMLSMYEEKKGGIFSGEKRDYFSIEIGNSENGEETVLYAAIPDSKKDFFEKHMMSVFPNAKMLVKEDDYNVFNGSGVSLGSYAVSGNNSIFTLKTYDQFDYDPLNVIINAFSKAKKEGEGAAIQIIFNPAGDQYVKKYTNALNQISKGVSVKEAINLPDSIFGEFVKGTKDFFKDNKKKDDKEKIVSSSDETAIENIKQKIESPIVDCNIRIIASASNRERAVSLLSDIESSFNQFENTTGNKLKFKRAEKSSLSKLLKDFTFRLFSKSSSVPLNIKEVTSFIHFGTSAIVSAPSLKQSKASSSSAPLEAPMSGTLLGINRHRNVESQVFMADEDRLRHFYTIGQTGTGKSTLLKNMIIQDIAKGAGVCMIDPHGIDIMDILANIPQNRFEDVIYFDPSYAERPMALNMLEYDENHPEQKTFVVNELFSIFQKLYGAVPESMGPMFEQYFRNATMLVIEDPSSGSTLVDVSRVLSNKEFRDYKISRCKNPIVVQFWKEIAEKAGGEGALANIVPYITSKFDVFLANDIMRPIIAQQKSSFNFRDIMDNKKILLVNLSKGKLGDINANLIGLILVGKILMSALSRVDSVGKDFPPFYLYIDEFQNITTNSIATILSEARKYKLSLNIAHQFIAQLEEGIKDAVFGNVGSIASFRVGAEDAEYLKSQFEPVFSSQDLMNLDNRNAYVKMLVNGKPAKPFNIETLPPPHGNKDNIEDLKNLSYLKYGADKTLVEAEIMKKYQKAPAI